MMTRTLLGLFLVGLALTACGCRMSASPYDYCGPLCDGSCGGTCDLNQPRAGEISVMGEPQLLQPSLAAPRIVEEVTLSAEEPADHVPDTIDPSSRPAWTAHRQTQSQVK